MLSRIRAWLSSDGESEETPDGDRGGPDAGGGEDGTVDRVRPLAPVKRESYLVGPAFVVLDGDDPGSEVAGEDLNRLHEAASERFDLAAVPEDHKVADVSLSADGEALDVEWYDEPVPVEG